MSLAHPAVDRFIALCNEPDADVRHALIDQTFIEDAAYFDTVHAGTAHEGIESAWTTVIAHVGVAEFSLTAEPETHHDWVRLRWALVPEDPSEPGLEGTYVGQLADDGRFARMIGFLDKVPTPAGSYEA